MTRTISLASVFGVALFTLGITLWSSCFAPTYSDCAFRCQSSEPKCPAEYECKSDGYCHLPDSSALCAIPKLPDLSEVVVPDLSMPDDASTSSDGS